MVIHMRASQGLLPSWMNILDSSFCDKPCSSTLTTSGDLPKLVPPRRAPPPINEKLWRHVNAVLNEERRRSSTQPHRAKRPRPGHCHAKINTVRPVNAGTASAGLSASVESSASAGPFSSAESSASTVHSGSTGTSASRGPSAGARPFGNARTPTIGGPFAKIGPTGSSSSSGNTSASGIGPQHNYNTDSSKNTSGPRVNPLPNQADFSHLCWICRRPFQISSGIKDNWKCFHQPLFIGNNGDLLPAQVCGSGHNPSIHVCCWEIAQKVVDFSILSMSYRFNLLRHIKFLSLFAEKTPFDIEPNSIDLELFTDSDPMSVMSDKGGSRQVLLETVLSKVSQLLDQNQTIIRIDELRKVDPCLAQWMTMANSYSVNMNKNPNVRLSLERVVRNLKVMHLDFQRRTIFVWHGTMSKRRSGP